MVTHKDAWTKIEGILIRVGATEKEIGEIKKDLKQNYVSKDQYDPVKKIMYGLVSFVLIAILAALLKVVLAQ